LSTCTENRNEWITRLMSLRLNNYSNSTFLMCYKMTIYAKQRFKRFFTYVTFKWFRFWPFCISYLIFIFGVNCLFVSLQWTWWRVIIVAFRTFIASIFWNIWIVVESRNIKDTSIILLFIIFILVFINFRLAFRLYLKSIN